MLNLKIASFATFLTPFAIASEAIALPCSNNLPQTHHSPYCERKLEFRNEVNPSMLTVEASNISLLDGHRRNIFVREIEIVGNTAFPAEAFEEIIASVKNRLVSSDDLVAVRSAITDKYVAHGYETSGAMALVPLQQVSGAADVTIKVLEGRLEKLEIHGLETLDEEMIRQHILATVDVPLSIPKLEAALVQLETHPQIQKVESRLIPGSTLKQSILIVNVTEDSTPQITLLE